MIFPSKMFTVFVGSTEFSADCPALQPGQRNMNEGTIILVEVLITADDAAFPGTVGAGKGNIANFAAGKT